MRTTLGLLPMPSAVLRAAQATLTAQAPGGAPLPGVFALPEISGSAPRDYLPAAIAGLVLLYAFTNRKRGRR